jgi:hypothetical protein
MGLILLVPVGEGHGSISMTETTCGGLVCLTDANGLEVELTLTVSELRSLAEHANHIATKVVKRPEWKP